jgi:hypothetical protein
MRKLLPVLALALAACTNVPKAVQPAVRPAQTQLARTPADLIGKVKLAADAIHDTLGAVDLAKTQDTITLLGNNSASIVANNGSSLISNKGGGAVNTTGTGLISEHGAGYRLAALPPKGAFHFAHAEGSLTYVTDFYEPDSHGQAVGYATAAYQADPATAPEVERLQWDGLTIVGEAPEGDASVVGLEFPVQVVKSAQLAFTQTIALHIDAYLDAVLPKPLTHFKAMQARFALKLPLRAGGDEQLEVQTSQFRYPPGAGPAELKGTTYPTPNGFTASGANARGTLEVTVDNLPNGSQAMTATYTPKAGGRQTKVTQTSFADGHVERTIRDEQAGFTVTLSVKPGQGGQAPVKQLDGGADLGTLSWGADGQANLGDEQLRVF